MLRTMSVDLTNGLGHIHLQQVDSLQAMQHLGRTLQTLGRAVLDVEGISRSGTSNQLLLGQESIELVCNPSKCRTSQRFGTSFLFFRLQSTCVLEYYVSHSIVVGNSGKKWVRE